MQVVEEDPQCIALAFGGYFDIPIPAVAHPTSKLQPISLFLNKITEADPLDTTLNRDM